MKFRGRVVKGQKLASKFGVATVNLDVPHPPKIREGVWFVRVRSGEGGWDGVLHFGWRMSTDKKFSIEVHLLNFSAKLYDQILEVETVKFLRETQEFQSIEALFEQIRMDCVKARKFFLRKKMEELWAKISVDEREQFVDRAVEKVVALSEFQMAKVVFAFAPDAREINFVQKLCSSFSQKKWAFPRVGKRGMHFFAAGWDELRPGKFGILEPPGGEVLKKTDLVFVPAVAAAWTGERLGRGGGFYDQFLCTNFAPTVCVLPEWAVVSEIPTEVHDQRVDRVIGV